MQMARSPQNDAETCAARKEWSVNEPSDKATNRGLYVQVYHTPLHCASRMTKIGLAVQATGLFQETHLVGIGDGSEAPLDDIKNGLRFVQPFVRRFPGGHLGRLMRVVLWYSRVLATYRRRSVSLVAAHSVWVLPLCWVLSRMAKCRLIYNAHELETESISMSGYKQRAAKVVEAFFIRRCALVSVVNEPIADWYQNRYGQPRPIVVGNTPVVVDGREELRGRLGVPNESLLYIHTGFLVVGRNIPLILDAFDGSRHHVVFLGDGPYRADVLAARERSNNIHWLPPVEHQRIVSHVRGADVGLCLIEVEQDLSDQLSSPNKLLETLAADIPPLCTDLVEARRLLGDQAEDWILGDPKVELPAALDRIDRSNIARFQRAWVGLKAWDDEVAPFTRSVKEVMLNH